MDTEYDIVVAGAGHNSLVCAAYCAMAGFRVLVLERAAQIGGDTSTEELTLPGFQHDACASAHVLFQSSPILRNDELGLGRQGLRYLFPEPAVVMPFRDGHSLTMFRDRAATVREIARFSESDARAYGRLLDDWDGIKDLQGRARYAPPRPPNASPAAAASADPSADPSTDPSIRLAPEAAGWQRSSAVDIVRERFEDEHVRAFILWLSLMTMAAVDRPGTGLLPFSITAGRQAYSWTTPVGGSIALPNALAAIVRARGGEILTGREVVRVLAENGRAVGVRAADGAEFRARRAVVSTMHVQHLPAIVGPEALGPDFLADLDRMRGGITMFVTHCAIDEPPRYRLEQGAAPAVAAGIAETTAELLDALAAFRRGEVHLDRPPLLCISSSVADPSRAPAGKHTLKIVGFLPYELRDGGPLRWDAIKDDVSRALMEHYFTYTANLGWRNVLARHVESPLDLERRNPHNWRGSCHGGDQDLAREMPVPAWAGYRMPLAGLYQTGSTTHPGASVTGAPGRNCAKVLLGDLGLRLRPPV